MPDTITFYVWPDETFVLKEEYSAAEYQYKGDDYVTLVVAGNIELNEFMKKVKEAANGPINPLQQRIRELENELVLLKAKHNNCPATGEYHRWHDDMPVTLDKRNVKIHRRVCGECGAVQTKRKHEMEDE